MLAADFNPHRKRSAIPGLGCKRESLAKLTQSFTAPVASLENIFLKFFFFSLDFIYGCGYIIYGRGCLCGN